jgi:hypothetical protein
MLSRCSAIFTQPLEGQPLERTSAAAAACADVGQRKGCLLAHVEGSLLEQAHEGL